CSRRMCCPRSRAGSMGASFDGCRRSSSRTLSLKTSVIQISPDRILRDEPDVLLHFAVEGARRLVQQRDFTIPSSSRKLLNEWMLQPDPVRAWASARLDVTNDQHIIAVAALYADFLLWAEAQGLKRDFLPSAISFGKRLRSAAPYLQYDRSDGSIYRNAKLRQK